MASEAEHQFFQAAENLRGDLLARRRIISHDQTAFLGALGGAENDMGLLLEPQAVEELQNLAEPLKGEPMSGISLAIGHYKGLSTPGAFISNSGREKKFAGIFRGVEIVDSVVETQELSSLCLVVDAFKKGKNGEYPYSSTRRLCKRTEYIDPVDGRLWVPAAPTKHLRIDTRHYDDAIHRAQEAMKEIRDIYNIFPQDKLSPVAGRQRAAAS